MSAIVFLQIFTLMFVANAVVYAGAFFINGALLPETLSFIYDKTSYIARVVICLISFLTVGNILFAKAFDWFNPVWVAPLNIAAFIFVQIIIAILVNRAWPSVMIIPAVSLILIGAYWVHTLLNVPPSS